MGPLRILGSLLACFLAVSASELQVLEYEAEMTVGSNFPSPATSTLILRGTLDYHQGTDSSVMRLREMSSRLHNGATNEMYDTDGQFLPLAEGTEQLLNAFTVHTKDNAAIGLSGVDGEADWSVNMKRSLASLVIPAQELAQRNSSAHVAKEHGLYGLCDAEYNIVKEGNLTSVQRYIDHSTCLDYNKPFYSNAPVISPYCPAGTDDYLTSSSDLTVHLKEGKVVHLESRGVLYFQPYKARGEVQQIITIQTLTPLSVAPPTTPPVAAAGEMTDLKLRMPAEDFTLGRSPMTQDRASRAVRRLLLDISANLDASAERDVDKLHDERVPQALFFMRALEQAQLEVLFTEYALGTSYLQETLKNVFLQLLSRAGSSGSLLLIRDLIVSKRVEPDESLSLLYALPFNVHQPSEVLLEQCAALYSLSAADYGVSIRRAGILAFATLVYKTCDKHCSRDTQDKYVTTYFQLFKDADTYAEQMTYLEGLSNMEDGKVFEYLQPLIRSHENNHLRFLAVWATMEKAMMHPLEVYALYWPILRDRNEPLEMRVAALTMLLVSRPSTGRFFSLHWFMTTEPNLRLKHFYYTTLRSLVNTKDPCYSLMSVMAAKVLRLLPVPDERHWATGNYVLDHGNPDMGFGGMAQLFLVANQEAELPTVFFLSLGRHAIGQRFGQLSVYLKLEGVSSSIKKRLMLLDPQSFSFPQLADLLRQIKAAPTADVPLHVELIVKQEGRVLTSAFINEETLANVAFGLGVSESVSLDQHLNYQSIENTFLTEHTRMTDLGIPALVLVSATSVASVRGNSSQVADATSFMLREKLDVHVSAIGFNNLMVYNPLSDVWHGVQRSATVKYVLPIEGSLRFDTAKSTLKFSLVRRPESYASSLYHVRSAVFLRGVQAEEKLHKHCATCNATSTISRGKQHRLQEEIVDVKVNELGVRLHAEQFDCEHDDNNLAMLRAALREQNYQVYPASQLVVSYFHVMDSMILLAPPGSCGTEVKLSSIHEEPTLLEGSLRFSSADGHHSARLALAVTSGSQTLLSWGLDVDGKADADSYHVSINLLRNASSLGHLKMCMDAKLQFPNAPANKLEMKASEPVTVSAIFSMAADGGATTCGGEPAQQLPIAFSLVAETTEEQATLLKEAQKHPFSTCSFGNSVDACYEAAHEMATLRKYTLVFNNSESLESAFFAIGRADGQLTASVEVSASRPQVMFTLGDERWTLDTGRHWIEPLLINTQYSEMQQVAMAIGLLKPQHITP